MHASLATSSLAALLALSLSAFAPAAQAQSGATAPAACPPLLKQTAKRLQDEKPQDLCQYAGKVVLVVNTASYCGFTPQYQGLEALYAKYEAQGLVVLGFPSNDFAQEDPDSKKIADLCFNTYGVKFPMFSTTPVRGRQAHPLFQQLASATGASPEWNFNKYLINRQGQAVLHFGSSTSPDSKPMIEAIQKALASR